MKFRHLFGQKRIYFRVGIKEKEQIYFLPPTQKETLAGPV